MMASTWSSLTGWPSLILISLTVPSTGASTGISIFIDSRMIMVSPSETLSPGFTSIFHTVPVMCALTSVGIVLLWRGGDDGAQLGRHRVEFERDRKPVDEAVVALRVLGERAVHLRRGLDDGAVAVLAG